MDTVDGERRLDTDTDTADIEGVSMVVLGGGDVETSIEEGGQKPVAVSTTAPPTAGAKSAGATTRGSTVPPGSLLWPTNTARHTRAWCRAEGFGGAVAVVILSALVVNLLVILVLHCTPLFDTLIRRPNVRGLLLISSGVSAVVGIMCSIMLARVVWVLVSITCRHGAVYDTVGRAFSGATGKSKWRIFRAWHLFELYTAAGGRYFDAFEFVREVFESCLQIVAVAEYADNGVRYRWFGKRRKGWRRASCALFAVCCVVCRMCCIRMVWLCDCVARCVAMNFALRASWSHTKTGARPPSNHTLSNHTGGPRIPERLRVLHRHQRDFSDRPHLEVRIDGVEPPLAGRQGASGTRRVDL